MNKKEAGFTLIEIMVVLIVIGILVAIAVPLYTSQIRKSRRIECESVLLHAASVMERRHAAANSYDGNAPVAQCPAEGATVFYTIAPSGAGITAASWELTAAPVGNQTQDKCKALTLNHLGEKQANGQPYNVPFSQECWR
jgi:type IV pilus assembly protein PilE